MSSPFEYRELSVETLAQIALDTLEDEKDEPVRAQVFATLAQAKALEEAQRR